jgi:threonine aldolase
MADKAIDLRSDTVTEPTQAMRRAMATAEVGDDWYGDDPTVNRLQDHISELTGKPAALFLTTGTLCNQIALHVWARSGHFVACDATAHVCGMELHSAAALSGIAFRRIPTPANGLLTAASVDQALTADPYDVGMVDLLTVENTHQLGGGTAMPVPQLAEIAEVAAHHRIPLYLDGARLFNACTVTGATVAEYATHANALMLSLSKGLGAPIGSVLAGDAEFIREARRLKIAFGGAWRQAGILAAAGLIALRDGPAHLADDHAHARRLAEGIAEILPGSIDPATVTTNIVLVDVTRTGHPPTAWMAGLAAEQVRVTVVPGRVRMLTHRDIAAADIAAALAAWRKLTTNLVTTRTRPSPR